MKRKSKLKFTMSLESRTNELQNSSQSKSAKRNEQKSKRMPKNRMQWSLKSAQRTSQPLMSKKPMRKQRKLLQKSSHRLSRSLWRILMPKEKSTKESNWKAVRTTATTK